MDSQILLVGHSLWKIALSNAVKIGIPYDNVLLFLGVNIPTEMCVYIHGETWKRMLQLSSCKPGKIKITINIE